MCLKYAHARHKLIQGIGGKSFTLTKLFTDEKLIPHTLTYLNKTGRFKNIYGDIAPG